MDRSRRCRTLGALMRDATPWVRSCVSAMLRDATPWVCGRARAVMRTRDATPWVCGRARAVVRTRCQGASVVVLRKRTCPEVFAVRSHRTAMPHPGCAHARCHTLGALMRDATPWVRSCVPAMPHPGCGRAYPMVVIRKRTCPEMFRRPIAPDKAHFPDRFCLSAPAILAAWLPYQRCMCIRSNPVAGFGYRSGRSLRGGSLPIDAG